MTLGAGPAALTSLESSLVREGPRFELRVVFVVNPEQPPEARLFPEQHLEDILRSLLAGVLEMAP
jgi:hypothetical protein